MMPEVKFTDALPLGEIKKTDDGLAVMARVARGGNVQEYLGSEMGVMDRAIVRVYRPESAVFSKDAIATYARKPITINHPSDGVTAENWSDLSVGEIDRDVMRDGEFVAVPLLVRDAKAISLIEAKDGPKELSMGYAAKVDMKDGVSPSGEQYDAVMTDFRMNHVALVSHARGGSELRIGDSAQKWGAMPVTDAEKKEAKMPDKLQTVVLGDQAVQVTADDVAAIEKYKTDSQKLISDMEAAHAKAIADKDAEIAKIEAAKDAAEAKVLSDADIDKRVADRAALVGTAKQIAPSVKIDGVSDMDIRKAVVVAKLGDAAVKDRSEAYIQARYDILAEDAEGVDPFAEALKGGVTDGAGDPWAFLDQKEA